MSDTATVSGGEKVLLVSSEVQAVLMNEILIHEIRFGFWAAQRPTGHGDRWEGVKAVVTPDGQLGPKNWEPARMYNVLNLELFDSDGMADRMVSAARRVKPNSTERSVKKELIELGKIIGKRLASRDSSSITVFRGNHRPDTLTASVRQARIAGCALEQVIQARPATTGPAVKPRTSTVVKRRDVKAANDDKSPETTASNDDGQAVNE